MASAALVLLRRPMLVRCRGTQQIPGRYPDTKWNFLVDGPAYDASGAKTLVAKGPSTLLHVGLVGACSWVSWLHGR